jgi:hypothetical protein
VNSYALIGAALLIAGAYAFGRHDGHSIEQAAQARAEDVRKTASDAMTAVVAEAIPKIRVTYTTIQQPLQKEFHNEVRYASADCSHTDTAWGLLDRAYQAAGGQPFGDPARLPAATPAAGPDVRSNH